MGLIEKYGLSDKEINEIVKEWYSNGMTPDIFQNEDGIEVDEYCDDITYSEIIDFNELGYEEITEDTIWIRIVGNYRIVIIYDFFKDYIRVTAFNNMKNTERLMLEGFYDCINELRKEIIKVELKLK